MEDSPTCLYRLWSSDGTLLYVGISNSSLKRLGQHLGSKTWTSDVALVTIEWFASRCDAASAEIEAICTERPAFNIVHSRTAAVARADQAARRKAGVAAARARGHVGGRRPKLNADQVALAQRLRAEGQTIIAIGGILGVSRPTVYKALTHSVGQ